MSWRIDEIKLVGLAIVRRVVERHTLRFDRDTALALEIHRIQDLLGHLPLGQAAAQMNEAVRQRGLAVIDVGDDRKVAYVLH